VENLPAEWTDAEPIVQNYAYQAMSGEISGAEAVSAMREELLAAGLIDE
jgi:putative aldouronate transport system substrate-binding protein